MGTDAIKFSDGAAYERYMGLWSRLAGETFLAWLASKPKRRWLDVGCGNGAFTEMIAEGCAPSALEGVDPSEEQLAFARTRPALRSAVFRKGDAMALPYADKCFDTAVMPLVIFFVPDPAKGVAEMARVLAPGGVAAAYSWDMKGGGFPYAALQEEMRAMDVMPSVPPSPEASRMDRLKEIWSGAGLAAVETREIVVQRTFADLGDFWETVLGGPSVGHKLKSMSGEQTAQLKERLRLRLPQDARGRITYHAKANAIMGRIP